jgi:transcriptional regulator with XRE-family HTH domain
VWSPLGLRPGSGRCFATGRQRRRLSQLELALEAGVSARHLSFVETGRSRPSPEMILQLAEQLDVPFRERNRLMLAAGYAPVYVEHPRIANLGEWRAHLLDRLGRQAVVSGDPALFALHEELAGYPGGEPGHVPDLEAGAIAVPLRVRVDDEDLAFISTATTFGTATDVTVAELAIESFFPADAATARVLETSRPRA